MVRHELLCKTWLWERCAYLGKNNPKQEELGPQEGEKRLVYALSIIKLFILNKGWPSLLCAGLLSRGSLSLDVLPSLQKVYDCIMIDGDHNWYTVYHELKSIHQHGILRPGGTIFFHDVGWPYGRRDMYYSLESIRQQYINPHNREGIVRGYSKTVANLTWPHDVAASEGGPKNGVLTAIEDFYHENKQDYGFCSCTSVEAGLGVLYKKGPIANDSAFRQLRLKLLGMSFKSLNAATAMQKLKTIISR